ncbi:uncharacterized protein LOC128266248 [Drosophila gunungcola]|nr:uncharacterized protein LOC128266248 [Drosophila gunungcola]
MQSCLMLFLFSGFLLTEGQKTDSITENVYPNQNVIGRSTLYINTVQPVLVFKAKKDNGKLTITFPNNDLEADLSTKNRLNRSSLGVRGRTYHFWRRIRTNRRRRH